MVGGGAPRAAAGCAWRTASEPSGVVGAVPRGVRQRHPPVPPRARTSGPCAYTCGKSRWRMRKCSPPPSEMMPVLADCRQGSPACTKRKLALCQLPGDVDDLALRDLL